MRSTLIAGILINSLYFGIVAVIIGKYSNIGIVFKLNKSPDLYHNTMRQYNNLCYAMLKYCYVDIYKRTINHISNNVSCKFMHICLKLIPNRNNTINTESYPFNPDDKIKYVQHYLIYFNIGLAMNSSSAGNDTTKGGTNATTTGPHDMFRDKHLTDYLLIVLFCLVILTTVFGWLSTLFVSLVVLYIRRLDIYFEYSHTGLFVVLKWYFPVTSQTRHHSSTTNRLTVLMSSLTFKLSDDKI
ncbi:hypothetical protein QTP88_006030 [Uroleucon formosanum]